MGYPGKPTDDVMALVRKMRPLAEEYGRRQEEGRPLDKLNEEIDKLEDKIHDLVSALDSSGDEYAEGMS